MDVQPPTAIKEFVLIPQHTAPANTSKELQALYQVLQDVKTMWRTEVGLQSELQVSGHPHVSVPVSRT